MRISKDCPLVTREGDYASRRFFSGRLGGSAGLSAPAGFFGATRFYGVRETPPDKPYIDPPSSTDAEEAAVPPPRKTTRRTRPAARAEAPSTVEIPQESERPAQDGDEALDAIADTPSVHDLLVNVLADDSLDFLHLVTSASTCHDRAVAGLKTLGQLLRLVDRERIADKTFLVADVGALVSHLADTVDAMATIEGHALYQLHRRRH